MCNVSGVQNLIAGAATAAINVHHLSRWLGHLFILTMLIYLELLPDP